MVVLMSDTNMDVFFITFLHFKTCVLMTLCGYYIVVEEFH